MKTENDIFTLQLRILEESATAEEWAEFITWLRESPDNKADFEELKKIWHLSGGPVASREQEEEAWRNCRKTFRRQSTLRSRLRSSWKYVAVVLLLIGIALYSLYLIRPSGQEPSSLLSSGSWPETYKATLTIASGETFHLNASEQGQLILPQGVTIHNSDSGIIHHFTHPTDLSDERYTITTPRGGEYKVTLSDGTHIHLNAESQLSYPVRFGADSREIWLKGEAFLEVASEQRPFKVNAEQAIVKVYGTSFNVNTHAISGTRIVLVSGQIGIRSLEGGDEVMIHPAEMIECSHEGKLSEIRQVNPHHYTAWKEGRFIFKDESLEEIMEILSRWYDVDVVFIDQECRQETFTGYIEKYDTIENILYAIAKIIGVDYFIEDRNVSIYKFNSSKKT